MTQIRKSLLQFIFSGFFMKRWNDKLRPTELVEIDKQAHKMLAAFMLFELNSQGLSREEKIRLGQEIVEGGLFDYFYRLVITDIKPPVFYKIKENPEHHRRLTQWVLTELNPRIRPLGPEFWDRLVRSLETPDEQSPAVRILTAAHLYASYWEFQIIKPVNRHDDEFREIEAFFVEGLAGFADLRGVAELTAGPVNPLGRLAHLCGQLRFQKRWSQTPRIPETSVIGHMYLVACYAYFFSLAMGACRARRVNNFFAGLVHDLPELLTRDIISPVKRSSTDLADLIKAYEINELDSRVLSPLTQAGFGAMSERLAYYLGLELGSEFLDTALVNGLHVEVGPEALARDYNFDEHDPKDGAMLKTADMLAAYLEAYTALKNGISSDQLTEALWRLRGDLRGAAGYDDVLHMGALLADFD